MHGNAEPRVTTASESSACSKTFVIQNEDHTLGNSLRYVLMQNHKVELCGYTIPHPMETVMHMRLQTKAPATADELFVEGLKDLSKICDSINSEFDDALESFMNE